MIIRIIIALVLSLIIYVFLEYLTFLRQNKTLKKINKTILQSMAMYLGNKNEIDNTETTNCKYFIIDRIKNENLYEFIKNFDLVQKSENHFIVKYSFKRDNEYQNISYEIKRN